MFRLFFLLVTLVERRAKVVSHGFFDFFKDLKCCSPFHMVSPGVMLRNRLSGYILLWVSSRNITLPREKGNLFDIETYFAQRKW